jgi:hypothetical protein
MVITVVGITALLFAVYGEDCWCAGVINIGQTKGDRLWHAHVYSGGPDERKMVPVAVDTVYVDPKAKDPFTGRLLLDEMRELLKSREIVYIRFNRRGGVDRVTTIERHIGLRLNPELSP